jgi:hypothetical protein
MIFDLTLAVLGKLVVELDSLQVEQLMVLYADFAFFVHFNIFLLFDETFEESSLLFLLLDAVLLYRWHARVHEDLIESYVLGLSLGILDDGFLTIGLEFVDVRLQAADLFAFDIHFGCRAQVGQVKGALVLYLGMEID